MATKKTVIVETTCDICNAEEVTSGGSKGGIFKVSCASRKIGYLDDLGNFHEDQKPMTISLLDLCPSCRERAYVEVVAEISHPYTTEASYSFLKDKVKQELLKNTWLRKSC